MMDGRLRFIASATKRQRCARPDDYEIFILNANFKFCLLIRDNIDRAKFNSRVLTNLFRNCFIFK